MWGSYEKANTTNKPTPQHLDREQWGVTWTICTAMYRNEKHKEGGAYLEMSILARRMPLSFSSNNVTSFEKAYRAA
jgi:hypothetical protein